MGTNLFTSVVYVAAIDSNYFLLTRYFKGNCTGHLSNSLMMIGHCLSKIYKYFFASVRSKIRYTYALTYFVK